MRFVEGAAPPLLTATVTTAIVITATPVTSHRSRCRTAGDSTRGAACVGRGSPEPGHELGPEPHADAGPRDAQPDDEEGPSPRQLGGPDRSRAEPRRLAGEDPHDAGGAVRGPSPRPCSLEAGGPAEEHIADQSRIE